MGRRFHLLKDIYNLRGQGWKIAEEVLLENLCEIKIKRETWTSVSKVEG